MKWMLVLTFSALVFVSACGRPSVGIGYGIPGTPVSVGASVPVGPPERHSKYFDYRTVRVESTPDAAEILVNNQLVGSTPASVSVPFEKKTFGGARGSALVLVRKPGYAPEGVTLYPTPGGHVSREPKGNAIGTITVKLRRM